MKNTVRNLWVFALLLVYGWSFGQSTPHTVFVNGDCGECQERIEKTAKNAGAKTAHWDMETQLLTFETEAPVTEQQVLKAVAEAGYDNALFTAPKEAYEQLPECCLYTRKPSDFEKNLKEDSIKIEHQNHPAHQHQKDKKDEKNIERITLTKLKEATALRKKEVGLTFNISSKELLKAACCNLSESFETNATVDVSFSNAVTGTKQLRMLGLDQKYTALTKELLPEIRGLATAYGLNFIPGRWIGGIQLTKGGSTVVNGYESITGQINTELVKLNKKPESTLNIFADGNGRTELNVTNTTLLSHHWNQSLLLHANGTFTEMDQNKDGFLDQPKGHQLNATYLLNYSDLEHTGWGSHFGINFLRDERKAGQKGYDWQRPQSEQSLYGVGINIGRVQLWNKTGFVFPNRPYQSLGWMNQFTYHQQDSFFGKRNYLGKETSFYSNLIFESIIGNTNHKYKVGASFLYDHYDETYLTENFSRTETVPGIFAEYTTTGENWTLVAGLRSDFHNLAGTQVSPRLNFKYDLTPKTVLRLSAGRGFRTANIFAESQRYFASNRSIEIKANDGKIYGLKPEIAWNYGASLQQEFKLFGRKVSWVTDIFRTDFSSQVLTDLDASTHKIIFYNLDGKSKANALQTQLDWSPIQNLELRLAYKYYDVWADYESGRRKIPFVAKHRGFFNASYSTTKNEKGGYWNFDATLQYIGKQRLPFTQQNPEAFQLPSYSKPYALLNAQIARHLNEKVRIYLGAENLTSYHQPQPIIDAENPFGNYFDGGMVYTPIMNANVYAGVDISF
ncbi:TonB-dependent receptor [Riemerella columbina]|uniref:TonB-dependent receptor n=1 Tax=Riemerella columbina TaxID=103810 RepID=UPI0026701951|nr:TonB-dependent receptor [Riemerella columbina]WKS95385.1 TonB-dependent receptor [Riemerella columbina]